MLIALPHPPVAQNIEIKAPHANIEIPPPVLSIEIEVKEKTEKKHQSVREEVRANFLKIMKKVLDDIYDRQDLTPEEFKQIETLLSAYNNLFDRPRPTSRRAKIQQWNEHVKAITQATGNKLP